VQGSSLPTPLLAHVPTCRWKAVTPAEVAARAGSRARDVYLGVDVHGRGTYGGGKVGGWQPCLGRAVPCYMQCLPTQLHFN
jgi:hypothetical protein